MVFLPLYSSVLHFPSSLHSFVQFFFHRFLFLFHFRILFLFLLLLLFSFSPSFSTLNFPHSDCVNPCLWQWHCGPEQPRIQNAVLGHSLVRSLIYSHRSLIHLLRPAHSFTCSALLTALTRLLARSLCSLPLLWNCE